MYISLVIPREKKTLVDSSKDIDFKNNHPIWDGHVLQCSFLESPILL